MYWAPVRKHVSPECQGCSCYGVLNAHCSGCGLSRRSVHWWESTCSWPCDAEYYAWMFHLPIRASHLPNAFSKFVKIAVCLQARAGKDFAMTKCLRGTRVGKGWRGLNPSTQYRCKGDIVKDYRQQLAELERSSGSSAIHGASLSASAETVAPSSSVLSLEVFPT